MMTEPMTNNDKAKQAATKANKDEQTNGRFPFMSAEVYGWIAEGIKNEYGTTIDISDFGKTRNVDDMIDIIGKMVKK